MKYQKDYYQILGIRPNATAEEVKTAYRRMVILSHPDRNASPEATAQMQEINEAYSVLGEPAKRMQYDFEHSDSAFAAQAENSPYAETANLQEFSAKETPLLTLNSLYFLLILVFVLLTVTLCASIPAITLLAKGIFYKFIVLMMLAILAGMGVTAFFWIFFRPREKESQCPKCGKTWAAEKLDEKLLGIFQKIGSVSRYGGGTYNRRGKYQIHYICKYCSYEWLFIKTKGI